MRSIRLSRNKLGSSFGARAIGVRGATTVDYVMALASVCFTVLVGWKMLGNTISRKVAAETHDVDRIPSGATAASGEGEVGSSGASSTSDATKTADLESDTASAGYSILGGVGLLVGILVVRAARKANQLREGQIDS
jgi:hypothetical protein